MSLIRGHQSTTGRDTATDAPAKGAPIGTRTHSHTDARTPVTDQSLYSTLAQGEPPVKRRRANRPTFVHGNYQG